MAVSYEQWVPAAEATQAYYPGVDVGPAYGAAYNLPVPSEYGGQQGPVFGDAISQTYVRRVCVCVPRRLGFASCRDFWLTDDHPCVSLRRSAREQIPV